MARRLFLVVALLTSLSVRSASAQGICSGRCLVNPQTYQPYCSLSVFGHYICIEIVDGCGDFACQSLAANARSTEDQGAPSQCTLASTAPSPVSQGAVLVTKLKART
jgi:hypothetical protein